MTNFTYNNGVPNSANDPSVDQPDMLINTQSIESLIAVDHVSFSTNDGGLHKQSTYLSLGSKPAVAGSQVAVYNKSGVLYFEDSAGVETQVSWPYSNVSPGFARLFGGMLVQWGSATVSDTGAVVFATSFTAVFSVVVSSSSTVPSVSTQSVVSADNITTSGFRARVNPNVALPINYVAIGTK